MNIKVAAFTVSEKSIYTSTRDDGTYRIGEQLRFRQACAYAQSRQSLRASYAQSMEVEEGSDQNLDL